MERFALNVKLCRVKITIRELRKCSTQNNEETKSVVGETKTFMNVIRSFNAIKRDEFWKQ